jgi:hypothetical protein
MSNRARLGVEGLEGRELLNGHFDKTPKSNVFNGQQNGVPVAFRGISYTAPTGAKVQVQVLGNGSIAGTTLNPQGQLDLVYSGTNAASKILINVRGGSGTAPLHSIHPLNVALSNFTGVGGQILGSLLAPKVDLVDQGQINLTPGIGRLQLHSIGQNTQIHLRELPQTVQPTGVTAPPNSVNPNPRPLAPGTVGVSQGVPNTPTAPATYSSSGRTLSYSNDANGGSTLTSATGQFTPGLNQVVYPGPTPPAAVPSPPGILFKVESINAGAHSQPTLGNGQIYGYDPTAGALIRFDAKTGAALQSIPVGGNSTTAGVGFGRNGSELVVLLGRGTNVQAFDAVTGSPVGSFNVSNLTTPAITSINGIGFNEQSTIITDSNAQLVPGSSNFGVAVAINVTASLAAGQAVLTSTLPYSTTRSLDLGGGATGVAGSTNFFLAGAAHFDSFQFQPTNFQVGVATLSSGSNGLITELARTAQPGKATPFVNSGPYGAARTSATTRALGAVENLLALQTGVVNGQNVVSLYSTTVGSAGTLLLNDPNPLVSLSTTFHPELMNTALIDVQGNIQAFNANTVHGLALNDNGNLNMVKIINANDSTIIGQPFGHLLTNQRNNLTVLTPNRSVGMRGGVTIVPTLRPIGPLSLPS